MDHDYIFVAAMLCSYKIDADSFGEVISYVEKIQNITDDQPEAVATRKEMLDNLYARLVSHQQNMRIRISELNQINSRAIAAEGTKRPAIMDVCSIQSGFLGEHSFSGDTENTRRFVDWSDE